MEFYGGRTTTSIPTIRFCLNFFGGCLVCSFFFIFVVCVRIRFSGSFFSVTVTYRVTLDQCVKSRYLHIDPPPLYPPPLLWGFHRKALEELSVTGTSSGNLMDACSLGLDLAPVLRIENENTIYIYVPLSHYQLGPAMLLFLTFLY